MIDGVLVKQLKVNADERGYLVELLRSDDPIFQRFGQAYVSLNYPGVVRAWHYHKLQTDFLTCVRGMVKAVMYDDRVGSPTRGTVEEYFIGEHNRILVAIPPGVLHGYKTISDGPSLLVNFPTEPYNRAQPDEYRLPWDSPDVPYDWAIKFH